MIKYICEHPGKFLRPTSHLFGCLCACMIQCKCVSTVCNGLCIETHHAKHHTALHQQTRGQAYADSAHKSTIEPGKTLLVEAYMNERFGRKMIGCVLEHSVTI